MRHSANNLIVPVFIPHVGCPHVCVFCNQKKITGNPVAPTPEEVRVYLDRSLSRDTGHAVIAFYGGSFTGLPGERQEAYLEAANGFVKAGHARGIRLSTRPDCIDAERARFLKERGVVTVELGVQSLDEGVLAASGRGHGVSDSMNASECVRSAGLELGIQLMAGLPGDSAEKFLSTIRGVVSIRPGFVRIYPVLVVRDVPLEALWRRGEYIPLPLEDAVTLCARAVPLLREAGIRVIRLGLQAGKELEEALLAGPYHPAFGHLVESELALERMLRSLDGMGEGAAEFRVNPSELSVYKGIKAGNIKKLGLIKKGMRIAIHADVSVQQGGLSLNTGREYIC